MQTTKLISSFSFTLVKPPRSLRVCISEKPPKYPKDGPAQKQGAPFHHHKGEAGGCALAKQWAGHRVRGPKSSEFLLHMLKSAESDTELKGLEVASLVIEHIQVRQSPQRCGTGVTELVVQSTRA